MEKKMPIDVATKGLFPSADNFNVLGWRWPHFHVDELKCKCQKYCEGEYYHHPEFLDALERFRKALGAPVIINSARRCVGHNKAVGGATQSQHMLSVAVDIKIAPHTRKALWNAAAKAGFTEHGMGFGANFLHLDWRAGRSRWDYGPAGLRAWSKALGFNPITGEKVL